MWRTDCRACRLLSGTARDRVRHCMGGCYDSSLGFQDMEGYAVAQLRHCTTCGKFLGSIPVGFFGIFQLLNPSTPRVDSACNINEYQGYLLGREDVRCLELTTLPPSYADSVENLGASTFWSPQGLSRSVKG
jgi:hypothetical protein